MPISQLDTQQKSAATSKGLEVAVSAGAGSGKTRLLVGRYLYLLLTKDVGIHEIAAITFTEKAAAQMKSAIANKAFEMSLADTERAKFWADISSGAFEAPITTIHAFCNGILRNYPQEAACDPAFTIIDDATRVTLLREAVERHVQECLDTEPELMEHLLGTFGLSRLKAIYRTALNNRVKMITWQDKYDELSAENIERNSRAFVAEKLQVAAKMIEHYYALAPADDKLCDVFVEAGRELKTIAEMIEADRVEAIVLLEFATLISSGAKKGSPKKWKESGVPISEARGSLKKCVEIVIAYAEFLKNERRVAPETAVLLVNECIRLEQRYLTMKKKRSAFDHDDTLIETWRLLRNNPAVCRKLSQTYKYFLVDEFQDTDSLQMDILRMIVGDSATSLFTVGDPKQSIYRFRGADVAVFNDFVAGRDVEFKTLKMNYRSSPGIISFVNHVFSGVMGRGSGIRYEAEYSEMKARDRANLMPVPVEIMVIEGGDTDAVRRMEAAKIAARIKRLNEREDVDFGDMAILFRKGTITRVYEEALLSNSIPYSNMTTGKLSDYPEIHDISNLTGWLCEPGDPALFCAVLISPFFMLDREILAGLRLLVRHATSMAEEFLYDDSISGHEWFDVSGLSTVRKTLLDLLDRRDRESIRNILEHIFALSGYTMHVLADPVRGELAMSVIDRVLQAAESFESNGGDIYQFAEQLREETIFSELTPSLESENSAVNLLTIHKSKGLEYRAVFIADAAGKPKSSSPDIGFHEQLGPAFKMREAGGGFSDTLASTFLAEEGRLKDIAESKRLFYVACTRAEDFLMILGGKPSKTADLLYEKGNWMGWLHSSLGIDPAGENTGAYDGQLFSYERLSADAPAEALSIAEFWSPLSTVPSESDDDAASESCLNHNDIIASTDVPPKIETHGPPRHLSPTQALDYMSCPAMYYYRHVWSLDMREGQGGGFGARYGTFAHAALELFDYDSVDGSGSVQDQLIQSLIVKASHADTPKKWLGKLSDEMAAFAASLTARSIAGAETVRREEPFTFLRDDVLIRGTMDVMYSSGDSIGIVDFKTDAIEAADVAAHSERYIFQLGIYALAAERAAFTLPETLTLYYLSPGIAYEISCDRDFLDRVSDKLSSVIASLSKGDYTPRKSSRCNDCLYQTLCGV